MHRSLRLLSLATLMLVPLGVQAAPAADEDAGGKLASRSTTEWASANAIDQVVRASGGRPTLIEFYDNSMIFT